MIKYLPGDRVIVEFEGVPCHGEVVRHSSGYVMARVNIPDAELDMGDMSDHLDPQPLVCVIETKVQAAQ